jgi:hypothetical protein
VGDGVVIAIEADIGRLADVHIDLLVGGKGRLWKWEQAGALLLKGLPNGAGPVFGAAALLRQAGAEGVRLRVEVVEVDEGAGREEGVTDVLNGPLDSTLGKSCQLQVIRILRYRFSG